MNLQALASKASSIILAAKPIADAGVGVAGALNPAVGVTASAIEAVILDIPKFIDLADEVLTGVSGPNKLAAVKAALVAAINALDPKLEPALEAAWGVIGPVISMIVTLKRFGFKF